MKNKRIKKPRKLKKTIFIFCQGTKTEFKYFEHIKKEIRMAEANPTVEIKIASQHKSNALQFVKYVNRNYIEEKDLYDEFWLVFDKDETSNDDFNKAVDLAIKQKSKVAYSNQAFELWLIHHFQELYSKMDRSHYSTKLSQLLGFKYDKDEKTAKKIAEFLFPKIQDAILNAENSFNKIEKSNPANEESSTKVYELAKSIFHTTT